MATAEVGDDYYREDPTVRELEDYTAELLGKEAALFVLSGTMGNLLSIRAQVPPGSAALVSSSSHLHLNETGHLASICGITSHPVPTPAGKYLMTDLEKNWPVPTGSQRGSVLNPRLKLIAIENTHNGEGGRCLDLAYLDKLGRFARERALTFHMDGARLFNAAVSLGVEASALAAPLDSISFCLSKGLGAPGGAMIVGDRDFIEEARHWRQMVGGGMRQAGVLAAAGLFALEQNIDRLGEDHVIARRLAEGLLSLGLTVDLSAVETNIVMAYLPSHLPSPATFHQLLTDENVLVLPPKGNRFRFVIHKDLSADDVDLALTRMGTITNYDRRFR